MITLKLVLQETRSFLGRARGGAFIVTAGLVSLAAVSVLVVGCSADPTMETSGVAEDREELLGESTYECNGGVCPTASETNHERTMKLGRVAARSAAFLECLDRAVRTGIPNSNVLATANMPAAPNCGSDPAYVYDGWGPYLSCTPYAETRFGADPVLGTIEHDGAWNERVDRQLARAFTAAQVDLDLHHRIGALSGGARQSGSPDDGTHFIDWGPLSPTADLNTKIGPAGNDSGDVGSVWHEGFHNLGYDHGCQPLGTNHGNCGRSTLWDGGRAMNNIAAFCIKEVLLRSEDPSNFGCGTSGVGARQTLLSCPNGGRMIVSEFTPNAGTNINCHCVPDVPGQENRAGDEFGFAAAAGDFDCDGNADLAIGAPGEKISGAPDAGALYLYRGSPQGLRPWRRVTPATVGISPRAGARMGHALATARFNQDCASDLVIGAPGWDGRGAVAVVPGGAGEGLLFDEARRLGGSGTSGGFGEAFAVGSFDDDATSDLAVGAPRRVQNGRATGRVYVYRGTNASSPSQAPLASLTTINPTAPANGLRFGAALAFGNVMGDDAAELVVGAPGRTRIDPNVVVTRTYGSIFVVSTSTKAMSEISVPLPGNFGERVVVGNIRGDGFDDVAASSPVVGRVYTLTGAAGGPRSPVQATDCGSCEAGRALGIFPRSGRDDLLVGFAGSDRVDQFHTYPGGLFRVTRSFDETLWSASHDPGDGRAGNCPKLDDINSHKECLIDEIDFSSDFASFGTSIVAANFGQGTQVAVGAPSDTVGFATPIQSGSLYVRGGDPPTAQEYRIDQVTLTYGGSPIDTGFRPKQKAHDFFCVFGQTCDVADVNGDGRADLVAFVKATVPDQVGDVYVSLAEGVSSFGPAQRWHDDFCTHDDQECTLADVTGDGRADLVAFTKDTVPRERGYARVAVARSTGGFGASRVWLAGDVCRGNEVCRLGRVNGDKAADLIVFSRGTDASIRSYGDVRVYTANPLTLSFDSTPTLAHDVFCVRNERCEVGDVDGDGDDDLLAFVTSAEFGDQGFVWVAETTPSPVAFGTAVWHRSFCTDSQQCDVGDVDGDGRVDLVRFSLGDELRADFALSNGNDFGPFSNAGLGFCVPGQVCRVADVNNDSRADLVRFSKNVVPGTEGDVSVALAGRGP